MASNAADVPDLEGPSPPTPLAPEWQEVYTGEPFRASSLLPPLTWLPRYARAARGRATERDLAAAGTLPYSPKGDATAGLTVGVMLVPQCLAFALLAGLPVKVGLYSSVAPLAVYALTGTIRQLQVGPTALMSLLTGQALDAAGLVSDEERIAGAALLALLVGCVSLLLGVVRFGVIVDFMSHTVMSAFCTAAGVIIATSQMKHMLGLQMPRMSYWWETAGHILTHLHETDLATAALGFGLLLMLVTLKAWKGAGDAEARLRHPVWRWLPRSKASAPFRALKLVADFASVISVVLGWLWAALYREAGVDSVRLIGDVSSSGFTALLPDLGAGDRLSGLLVSAVVMAVVGFLETVAIGGKFAAQHRYSYDANQELIALGLANGASAFMSGFPITGGFSRTAVNAMFGATSQLTGVVTASVVLLAAYLLLGVVADLPLAALAPLIIQGALGVTNFPEFGAAYRANKPELGVMVATFLLSMALSVKEGLFVGFGLSVCKTLYEVAVPNLVVCGRVNGEFRDIRRYPEGSMLPGCVVVRIDAQLNFSNARRLQEFCVRALQAREKLHGEVKYLLIDCKAVNSVDLTGVERLETMAKVAEARGTALVLANLKGPVVRGLCAAHAHAALWKHGAHLCWDMEQAVAIVEGKDPKAAREAILDLDLRVRRGESPAEGCLPTPAAQPKLATL